jgi:hypothetical protein
MQKVLDDFMRYFNNERTNQGKRCKGRTPYETFLERKEKMVPVRRWKPEVETESLQ